MAEKPANSKRTAPPASEPDEGIFQGRSVAREAISPDGMIVLIGKTAEDNDILSLRLASSVDFWYHVAGESGSHVIVRNPEKLGSIPKDTRRFAAALAAGYSRARKGGMVAVHETRVRNISKRRGMAPGKVLMARHTTIRVRPLRLDDKEDAPG